MINTDLLRPRNFLLIAAFAIIGRFLLGKAMAALDAAPAPTSN